MAKGKNEVCGGPWGTSGSCASGLNCLKICKYHCNYDHWSWQVEGRCVNPAEVLLMSGSCHIRRVEIVVELGIFVFF